jgi:hypothetical protein
MNHVRPARGTCWCLALVLAAASAGALAAHDSGDSSMNPYTGDSYAYFHGGHNLGEGAMIRPGGTPPPTGWQLYPWRGHAASDAPAGTPPRRAAQAPQQHRYVPAANADAPATAR